MSLMEFDVVYKTYADQMEDIRPGVKIPDGGLDIKDGTVNVYFSAEIAKPVDATEMTLDPLSPASGPFEVKPIFRWILVEVDTPAPVVEEFRAAIVIAP